MKLYFEPNLDYQLKAIESVCDLFARQEVNRTEFTVTRSSAADAPLPGMESDLGIGNRLKLQDEELLENLHAVQLREGLPPSSSLGSGDFTVEMETGTGKTYVYLRTIFELNRRFGFTKFVIVVPSIAIKEGVFKSLQITEDHFRTLFAGAPFDYFLYDSSRLGQVRNFATSPNIQIMVVTVGAINRATVNNIYQPNEKTNDEKPIDLIKATQPVLIVDEPQSVDGGLKGQGKQALEAMNPLCTLRYSATHAQKYNMVYRLDAIDAYEQRLVKQIEVASATIEDAHNRPYVRLVSVANRRGQISACVEVDVANANGSVTRQTVTVLDNDNLEQVTFRDMYADCRIGEIRVAKGSEFMELFTPGGQQYLSVGEAFGDVEPLAIQTQMIRRTIKEHLDKEKRLRPQGIKVLSLFFIDAVDRYRQYDEKGNAVKGDYARIFEAEYSRFAAHPDYRYLFGGVDLSRSAEEVHDGYFSIDRKGGWSDTDENNQSSRDNSERAYNLIMKDKERLLSFDTPLKFIFSHSALREGWDSPNVFQICTLRNMQSERERRQSIGRGLRLCVNQHGERVRGFEINTLTVIANESYEQFAQNLQQEIEQETGIKFGILEHHDFANIPVRSAAAEATSALGFENSKQLWDHLKLAGMIGANGKVLNELREAIKENAVPIPAEFEPQRAQITGVLRKVAGRLEVKNADDRRKVELNKAVYVDPKFRELWDRVKHKTTYRVEFDNEALIRSCTKALRDAPPIPRTRLVWRKADIAIGKSGVDALEKAGGGIVAIEESDIELPDVLTALQDRTQLTRRSICKVLIDSERLNDFKRNPQQFIEIAGEAINRCKRHAVVDGIKYQRIGDSEYYAQELFEQQELTGYLKNMRAECKKSIYEEVVYDSGTEGSFATDLENNDAVKLYVKLPGWFKVPTPLGTYNPDWAILVETDGDERLYFVVETKSSLFADDIRYAESAKIKCGKAHFDALMIGESPARYEVASSVDELLERIGG